MMLEDDDGDDTENKLNGAGKHLAPLLAEVFDLVYCTGEVCIKTRLGMIV